MPAKIPMRDLLDGHVYEVRSRNLAVGVWRASTQGFIGVRQKWDSLYLFEEYDYETGPPHGTASAVAWLGPVPKGMLLTEENDDLFELLLPLDLMIHRRRAYEDELVQQEADSKRWAPPTREEVEKERRIEAVKEWHRAESRRLLDKYDNDEEARVEALRAHHREWVRRLEEAHKGENR